MITASRIATALLLMGATASANAHELFVSFAKPAVSNGQAHTAIVSNGTFDESVGVVSRDRLQDVSVHHCGARIEPDLSGWKAVGKQSQLTVQSAGEGTVLLGISTMPTTRTLTSAEFANYLKIEDLPDTLASYDATEYPNGVTYSYTKHARAIGQVGSELTEDYAASLGYPLEIRLLRNPGSVKVGERLTFQVRQADEPVPNLRVYVGSRADAPVKGGHGNATLLRTDANGQASFDVTAAKTWYIHTNLMAPSEKKGLDFVSDRASLTFDIPSLRNGHP